MFDWAKDIYKNIQESNDNEYKKEISFLKEQTKIRQEQYINFVINMEKQLDKYVDENASLKERINTKDEKEALEIEWNNKRQQSNY